MFLYSFSFLRLATDYGGYLFASYTFIFYFCYFLLSDHSIYSTVDVRHVISARLVRLVIYFCVFIGAGDMTGLYRFHTLHRFMYFVPLLTIGNA